MEDFDFDIKTFLIGLMICVISGIVIKIVCIIVKSGILRKIANWFTATRTGNTVRRICSVLLFLTVAIFIGYFIYTGTQI